MRALAIVVKQYYHHDYQCNYQHHQIPLNTHGSRPLEEQLQICQRETHKAKQKSSKILDL